jgi:hypothetical protein
MIAVEIIAICIFVAIERRREEKGMQWSIKGDS